MKKGWLSVTKKHAMGILAGVLGALSVSGVAAQTFSWTFTTIEFPGFASVTVPLSINNHGDIVGFYDDSNGAIHGYLRRNGGDFVSVDFPGSVGTSALSINDRGDIVGTYFDPAGFQHGFLLSDGVFTSIDYPGAAQTKGIIFELAAGLGTAGFGLNRHGDIVGEYADSNKVAHGYLLRRGRFSSFDAPGATQSPGSETSGVAINSFGDIVGGVQPSVFHGSNGFLLKNGQFTIIAPPDAGGGFGTIATGINDRGDIVGSYSDKGYDFHGFARIDGHYIRIDFPGASKTETYRINDDQTIVGGYADQAHGLRGYIGVRNP
ncbi:MAG TPA: hypothetical protein VNI54_14145 [Thermoanaerobaculia bacterium]|nr:hypothetical protein [Thermoanaerobaculia bacterium]